MLLQLVGCLLSCGGHFATVSLHVTGFTYVNLKHSEMNLRERVTCGRAVTSSALRIPKILRSLLIAAHLISDVQLSIACMSVESCWRVWDLRVICYVINYMLQLHDCSVRYAIR